MKRTQKSSNQNQHPRTLLPDLNTDCINSVAVGLGYDPGAPTPPGGDGARVLLEGLLLRMSRGYQHRGRGRHVKGRLTGVTQR